MTSVHPSQGYQVNNDRLNQILNLARWAPSGDNTQPWRFEIAGPLQVRVHGSDTREHILYDYDGHASHIAHGALLETMRIAASGYGLMCQWTIHSQADDRNPVYEVTFWDAPNLARDPLFSCIESRTVQRRPMRTTALTQSQHDALTHVVGEGFTLQILDSLPQRLQIARLLWNSAHIRLTCPEAYPVHKSIIEWKARYSKDRIPEQAVGVDPATARLMQWALASWGRVEFLNRFAFGTVVPRIQLDLLPAIFCAAHVLIRPDKAPQSMKDWVDLGIAVQKLWLTATHQGLHLQPQMTPAIFRWYTQAGRTFSEVPRIAEQSLRLAEQFERLTKAASTDSFGFFARVGMCQPPRSRSTRRDLNELVNH